METNLARAVVWTRWEDIVGPAVASHAWPSEFFESRILVILVTDSVWMHQLSLERLRILEMLNSRLPEKARFSGVRFRIGDVSRERMKWAGRRGKPERQAPDVDIMENQKEEIARRADEMVRAVSDPGVRRALRQMYVRYLSRSGAGEA